MVQSVRREWAEPGWGLESSSRGENLGRVIAGQSSGSDNAHSGGRNILHMWGCWGARARMLRHRTESKKSSHDRQTAAPHITRTWPVVSSQEGLFCLLLWGLFWVEGFWWDSGCPVWILPASWEGPPAVRVFHPAGGPPSSAKRPAETIEEFGGWQIYTARWTNIFWPA